MTRINLLPWREARRTQRQRDLVVMLTSVAIATAGIAGLVTMEIDNRIQYQKERNTYLINEIEQLKKAAAELEELKKTRTQLDERIKVIQDLQSSRPKMVEMLDKLVRIIPKDIYLTFFKIADNGATLKGAAISDNVIAKLMRDMRGLDTLFGEPELRQIETRMINNIPARLFELVVPLRLKQSQANPEKQAPAGKDGKDKKPKPPQKPQPQQPSQGHKI